MKMEKKNPLHNGNSLRTWIEIDAQALEHNYRIFRSVIKPKTQLMAVVKSNAYGHGLLDFSRAIEKLGVDWLGVDSVIEGIKLRKEGVQTPILVLGHTLSENFPQAAEYDISLTISSLEQLLKINSWKLKIHLKIDTGMHRQGFFVEKIDEVINLLRSKIKDQRSNISIEGVYTHLANAKNPSFFKDTRKQLKDFNTVLKMLKEAGYKPMAHAAATGGTLIFPEAHYDLVRVGIGFYGLWPSQETEAVYKEKILLKPILSWKTMVSEVKELKEAGRVGYDFTESVSAGTRLAVCPVGYWHGYPRALSSVGQVLARGKKARVVGRVSMDMIVIDVTRIKNVKAGDVVTLIGRDGKEEIGAHELAELAGTINYELVTRLNPLIKRVLI